jgi:hypothetical protein
MLEMVWVPEQAERYLEGDSAHAVRLHFLLLGCFLIGSTEVTIVNVFLMVEADAGVC